MFKCFVLCFLVKKSFGSWLLFSLSLSAGLALFGCLGRLLSGLWRQGKQSTCCVHRGAVWVWLLELNRTVTTSIPLSSWRHWALYTTRTILDHVGSWNHAFCRCYMLVLVFFVGLALIIWCILCPKNNFALLHRHRKFNTIFWSLITF